MVGSDWLEYTRCLALNEVLFGASSFNSGFASPGPDRTTVRIDAKTALTMYGNIAFNMM